MKTTEIISVKYPQKRSLATLFCVALTMLCLFTEIISFSMYAEAKNGTEPFLPSADEVCDITNDILYHKMISLGQSSLQELIDNDFCHNATDGNVQTYVQALIRDPFLNPDLSAYTIALANALNSSVSAGDKIYPTSVQKTIITLCECQKYISDQAFSIDTLLSAEALDLALNSTIGEKGIMSYIYGLKMLEALDSAGIHAKASYTKEETILTLISLQLTDGGYALIGETGDTDVTAMTLQALSGIYKASAYDLQSASDLLGSSDTSVSAPALASSYAFSEAECAKIIDSIDASINFLKSNQLPEGDYASSGNACSESTAQVIIAVADLALSYNDFVSNGSSLLDGLLKYQMSDGGFTHTLSPEVSNDMACAQAFEALCAYSSVTAPEAAGHAENNLPINDHPGTDSNSVPNAPVRAEGISKIRLIICIVISSLLIISILVFTVKYAHSKKLKKYIFRIFSAVVVALLAMIIVFSINIQSKQDYETAESNIIFAAPGAGIISVTYSIDCSSITKDTASSTIYHSQTLYIADGSTVFDVLREVCRQNNIQLDYESNAVYGTAYIKGINSLYENDYGDLSGWMYRVNGDFPSVGCGYMLLSDGDCVEWLYTTNLGEDLKND